MTFPCLPQKPRTLVPGHHYYCNCKYYFQMTQLKKINRTMIPLDFIFISCSFIGRCFLDKKKNYISNEIYSCRCITM